MERSAALRDSTYNSYFYKMHAGGSMRSAREVVKVVKNILHPKTVIDVGCGIGTWLRAWLDAGVDDIVGIDGRYVRSELLLFPPERFRPMDLSSPQELAGGFKPMAMRTRSQPADRFDLVESLEVAEHLPKDAADAFVSFLCSLGPVVLFGAAIPYQGGSKHYNEQWLEYWAELFARRGYLAVDAIRDPLWNNPNVEIWYLQNTLIYVQAEHLKTLEGLRNLPVIPPQGPLSKVHPRLWIARNESTLPLEKLLLMLPKSMVAFPGRVYRKLRGIFSK